VLIFGSFGFRLVAMSNSLILSMELMKKKLPISSKPSSLRIIWSSKTNYVFTHLWKIRKHIWSSSLKESKNDLLEGHARCQITHSLHPSSLHHPQKWKKSFSIKYPNWACMPLTWCNLNGQCLCLP
jgi:hypothetical protein